jgi:hypothetical protein
MILSNGTAALPDNVQGTKLAPTDVALFHLFSLQPFQQGELLPTIYSTGCCLHRTTLDRNEARSVHKLDWHYHILVAVPHSDSTLNTLLNFPTSIPLTRERRPRENRTSKMETFL